MRDEKMPILNPVRGDQPQPELKNRAGKWVEINTATRETRTEPHKE